MASAFTPAPPVARSPIAPAPPVAVVAGWEVSARSSGAPLRLADVTPLAKALVRTPAGGPVAEALGVPFGRSERHPAGTLIVGSGPDEWTLIAPAGTAAEVPSGVRSEGGLTTVVDVTHGRALVRLTGADAANLLSKVCAVDLSDAVTPNGAAFRSSVAKLVTDVVRDDVSGERSYLLHCERSSGQFLFDSLLDAGREFGVEVDGFASASHVEAPAKKAASRRRSPAGSASASGASRPKKRPS